MSCKIVNVSNMLARKLDDFIERHYANNKSALLLKGARQVGKTSAIREYAKRHKMNLIEINFYEDDSACSLFSGAQTAKDVLLRISAHTRKRTSLPNTMVFFDEVQKCPEIITWIKFLVDEGSCRYALSGSLLGVELQDIESVPVGYMAVKEVFPLDLEEFFVRMIYYMPSDIWAEWNDNHYAGRQIWIDVFELTEEEISELDDPMLPW